MTYRFLTATGARRHRRGATDTARTSCGWRIDAARTRRLAASEFCWLIPWCDRCSSYGR